LCMMLVFEFKVVCIPYNGTIFSGIAGNS
jgi:hypothetical protein